MVTALGTNTVRIIPLGAKPLGHVWLPVDTSACGPVTACHFDMWCIIPLVRFGPHGYYWVYHPLSSLWAHGYLWGTWRHNDARTWCVVTL